MPRLGALDEVAVGRRFGDLDVEAELGHGAFGTVYRARDRTIGRLVALKVVRPHGGDPSSDDAARRLLREARALGALVHRNVATLYRVHTPGDGSLVLELEFVDGVSYEALLAGGARLTPDDAEALARGAAAGLFAAHGAHVVHGDVKPANVLRARDGGVKLVDFGLARGLEPDAARSSAGRLAGTPQYLAPEVVEGAPRSPASDVWSLGTLLYRAVAGRLPFDAASMPGLFFRILNTEPAPLPEGTPPALRELVLACLAKRPEDRPTLAPSRLAALDGARPMAPTVRADAVVVGARPLVGRGVELAALRERMGRVAAGATEGVRLVGAAGVGKSRLATALAQEARARGFAVVLTAVSAAEGLLRPLHRALVAATRASDSTRRAAPAPDTPEVAHLAAVERRLAALAHERAVVVVVDDLHRAADEDVSALGRLAARLQGTRTLLVATERVPDPDAPADRAPRGDALPGERWARVVVEPLPRDAVARVLVETATGDAPPDLVERAVARAGGNPLFAQHLLAHAVEAREAARRAGAPDPATTATSDPPPLLRDLMARRLRGLPEDLRETLDAAAVDGVAFDAEEVAAALGAAPLDVLRRLQRLAHRPGLVEPLDRGYRFAHPLLQETVYAEVAPDLRRALHRALATSLEARADAVDPERLGGHWERADDVARAVPHLLRAARAAALRLENWRAVDLGTRAGLVGAPSSSSLRAAHVDEVFAVANALGEVGRVAERDALFDAVARAAERDGDVVGTHRVAARRGLALVLAGTLDPTAEAGVAAAAGALPDGLDRGLAWYVLALAAKARRAYADAAAHIERADAQFVAAGETGRHGTALDQRASLALLAGRPDEAVALFREAARTCRAAGRAANAEISEVNAALAEITRGRVEGHGERLARAAVVIESEGGVAPASRVRAVLSSVHWALGDLEAARAVAAAALRGAEAARSGRAVADACAIGLELAVAAGDDAPAAALFERGRAAAFASGGDAAARPFDALDVLRRASRGDGDAATLARTLIARCDPRQPGVAADLWPLFEGAALDLLPATHALADGTDRSVEPATTAVERAEATIRAALEARAARDPEALDAAAVTASSDTAGLRRALLRGLAQGWRAIAARLRGMDADADRLARETIELADRLGHRALQRWARSLDAASTEGGLRSGSR
ncbi:MAG: protein kinase [Planctomycetes bacterium]|nr:protein kinase [Planctomycetota bacterium]